MTTEEASTIEGYQPKTSMRRHHFLSLRDTGHPPDSISRLIGAEADQKRRRSTRIAPSPAREMASRLHSAFCGVNPSEADSPKSDASSDHGEADNAPYSPRFLGRVHSYSRIMHAHTKSQLARPAVGTLPSYRKTMHTFTLNQLNSHRQASQTRSEATSPRIGTKLAVPATLQVELSKLVLDEVPPAPGSTPEGAGAGSGRRESHVHGIDFRKLKRRSITYPDMVRSMGSYGIGVRDFAAG